MKGGYYKNLPVNGILKVKPDEIAELLTTQTIKEADISSTIPQTIHINLSDFTLHINGNRYPIAASEEKTLIGGLRVAEKLEYPYWKKDGYIFVPGPSNPIGIYLIILADLTKGKKIPYSIHKWPLPPYADHEFVQGGPTKGCIRTRQEDIKNIFHQTELGALVLLHKN